MSMTLKELIITNVALFIAVIAINIGLLWAGIVIVVKVLRSMGVID